MKQKLTLGDTNKIVRTLHVIEQNRMNKIVRYLQKLSRITTTRSKGLVR
jgi:hypothetical protein